MPAVPPGGLVGRDGALGWLRRRLSSRRWAVVTGPGGVGKTALAAALAGSLRHDGGARRVAWISLATQDSAADVMDLLGRQLLPDFTVAAFGDLTQARLAIEQVLLRTPVLLVVDQLDALAPRPDSPCPQLLAQEARHEQALLLDLCRRLLRRDGTWLLLTSRAALPAPFDDPEGRLLLGRLDDGAAAALAMHGPQPCVGEQVAMTPAEGALDQFVSAARGHPRLLAQLGPLLHQSGAPAAWQQLQQALQGSAGDDDALQRASIELSLCWLPRDVRLHVQVLGILRSASVVPEVLQALMGWDPAQVAALTQGLCAVGLAQPGDCGHVQLLPDLASLLHGRLGESERQVLTPLWGAAFSDYAGVLGRERRTNRARALALTRLVLPDLLALPQAVQAAGSPAGVADVAALVLALLQPLERPRLAAQVARWRDAAVARLDGAAWSGERCSAGMDAVEQACGARRWQEARDGAHALLRQARAAGAQAYGEAGLDLARLGVLAARVEKSGGRPAEALPLLDEADHRLRTLVDRPGDEEARWLLSVSLSERAAVLEQLDRLDEAVAAVDAGLAHARRAAGHARQVAILLGQLGNLRSRQRHFDAALAAYEQAGTAFEALGESGAVAAVHHQAALAHLQAGQPQAAEQALRAALALQQRLGDLSAQAQALNQLGTLCSALPQRREEALAYFREAVRLCERCGDVAGESLIRANLGDGLRQLGRLDEARVQARRAIDLGQRAGGVALPWALLVALEAQAGPAEAALQARRQALEGYMAYRRSTGVEIRHAHGRLARAVGDALAAGDRAVAQGVLAQLAGDPLLASAEDRVFVDALQAIVSGRRDRGLAEAAELRCLAAAEILLLLERIDPC